MKELFRDLGMALSSILLLSGAYLIYDAVSNIRQDSGATLLIGAAVSSVGLVLGHSSLRLAYSVREWKRHSQNPR
jgi:hypothetical protein